MTNPDTPLDLDALLERFGDAYAAACVEQTDASDARREEAAEAIRAALAAVTAERDHYLRSFKAQQAENERVHAKVREQYDVIEHAKKQRDEAIEQAKQAQAELAALQVQYAGVQMERDLANEQLRGWRQRATGQRANAAAASATCSCQWSPVQGRIWCDSCAAARDAVVEAAAAPQADEPDWDNVSLPSQGRVVGHGVLTVTRDDAVPATAGTHATGTVQHWPGPLERMVSTASNVAQQPVPAGGEDGSGTADGNREEPA